MCAIAARLSGVSAIRWIGWLDADVAIGNWHVLGEPACYTDT